MAVLDNVWSQLLSRVWLRAVCMMVVRGACGSGVRCVVLESDVSRCAWRCLRECYVTEWQMGASNLNLGFRATRLLVCVPNGLAARTAQP